MFRSEVTSGVVWQSALIMVSGRVCIRVNNWSNVPFLPSALVDWQVYVPKRFFFSILFLSQILYLSDFFIFFFNLCNAFIILFFFVFFCSKWMLWCFVKHEMMTCNILLCKKRGSMAIVVLVVFCLFHFFFTLHLYHN